MVWMFVYGKMVDFWYYVEGCFWNVICGVLGIFWCVS